MKKTILTVALAAALGATAHAQNAAAPLADLSIKVNADYESQYVFRGKKITNGAFQPSLNLSYPVGKDWGTIGAYVWTSEAVGRHSTSPITGTFPDGPNQPNEVDIGTMWDYDLSKASDSLKGWGIELGDQEYWYPQVAGYGTVSRSNELHLNVNYDTTSVLGGYNITPTFWYYHDVILDSNTLALSVSYTWDLSKQVLNNLSLIPSATVGWTGAHRWFGDQVPAGAANWRDSYVYWLVSLEADYKIKDWATAFIGVRASGNNDGTVNGFGGGNPQAPGGGQNNIWAGVGVYMGM